MLLIFWCSWMLGCCIQKIINKILRFFCCLLSFEAINVLYCWWNICFICIKVHSLYVCAFMYHNNLLPKNHKNNPQKKINVSKLCFFYTSYIMMLFSHFTSACIVYWSIFLKKIYIYISSSCNVNTRRKTSKKKSFVLWNVFLFL